MKNIISGFVIVWLCVSCKTSLDVAKSYDFPKPVDTADKLITRQEKKVYQTSAGLSADNLFNSARLNGFEQENDSSFTAIISPENTPINHSAWYAFRLWAKDSSTRHIKLKYTNSKHRYHPKLSYGGDQWERIKSEGILFDDDSINVTLKLSIGTDTLWVAAQEIQDSKRTNQWCAEVSKNSKVNFDTIGLSPGERPMNFLELNRENNNKKKIVVIFSRQHPPEVTGFLAMQAFVKGIIGSDDLDKFLDNYSVLIYPMINPDGVDMGHWRHNTGGVDLNRDWAYYRQPETQLVSNHLVNRVKELNGEVVLGLDFHSTYHDVYYTQDKDILKTKTTPWFRESWFQALEENISDYKINEEPADLGTPNTKGWFYTQFGSEGMTYEIGDDTPREEIKVIGKISAEQMMRILMESEL